MIKPKVGFIVYGVHKDGLKDPMGVLFAGTCAYTGQNIRHG